MSCAVKVLILILKNNNKGVFYTYDTELMKEPFMDYLKGANADSMVVLSKQFAKDDRHVYKGGRLPTPLVWSCLG